MKKIAYSLFAAVAICLMLVACGKEGGGSGGGNSLVGRWYCGASFKNCYFEITQNGRYVQYLPYINYKGKTVSPSDLKLEPKYVIDRLENGNLYVHTKGTIGKFNSVGEPAGTEITFVVEWKENTSEKINISTGECFSGESSMGYMEMDGKDAYINPLGYRYERVKKIVNMDE